MRLAFDIETNGLLDTMDTIHCIAAIDVDTGDKYSWRPEEIDEGIQFLADADCLIGHNIIKFDIPAIQLVYPEFRAKDVFDTLVVSRLIWPDLADRDHARIKRGVTITGKLVGSHSLKAWGCRLGEYKDDYDGGWEQWSEEMHSYCEQDAVVTVDFLKLIEKKQYSTDAIKLEHEVAITMASVERFGFAFDSDAAEKLTAELTTLRASLEDQLQDTFKPWYAAGEVVTPKRSIRYKNRTKGDVTEGASYTKLKYNVFNASSRHHIANRLQTLFGWKPKEFTSSGQPKVDETTLSELTHIPECKLLVQYLTVQKRLGQLAEGKQSWMDAARETGRVHATYQTNGAVTGRMIHRSPNIAQVPATRAWYGKECRELFTVGEGKSLVGVDLSGLELRCLAHFMARFDDGEYGEVVLNGDIHTTNQEAAGLETRDQAKTFIYAFLYGAGAAKIGTIVGQGQTAGQRLKERFLAKTPALASLISAVQGAAKRGYLKGLDGRHVHVRSQHAALNTLLQSAGALISKQWIVEFVALLEKHGLNDQAHIVAHVHDEMQVEADDSVAEQVKTLAIEAAALAGKHFNLRIPIDADGTIGSSWADTH